MNIETMSGCEIAAAFKQVEQDNAEMKEQRDTWSKLFHGEKEENDRLLQENAELRGGALQKSNPAIDPERMSGCEIAAAFKQLLPAAIQCGLSADMLNAIDEETLIDHIINSDVSLEKVIRECSKALIQIESEPKMMPKVEALIQELLDEPCF